MVVLLQVLQYSCYTMKKETALANETTETPEIKLRRGSVDLTRGEVRYPDGGGCQLSAREADLLRYFAENAGRVISRDEILSKVWRLNPRNIITRVIDMHVVHLRGKLRDTSKPQTLRTVHGQGYLFVGA